MKINGYNRRVIITEKDDHFFDVHLCTGRFIDKVYYKTRYVMGAMSAYTFLTDLKSCYSPHGRNGDFYVWEIEIEGEPKYDPEGNPTFT
jgi:hypothetical protein